MAPYKLPTDEELERIRIGATVRAIREALDRKIDDVASELDISRPYLANIEAGRKPLTHALCRRMVAVFQLRTSTALVRPGYFTQDEQVSA